MSTNISTKISPTISRIAYDVMRVGVAYRCAETWSPRPTVTWLLTIVGFNGILPPEVSTVLKLNETK